VTVALAVNHMEIIRTSLKTDNHHASILPLSFYRPDAFPAAQPTVSKHWQHDAPSPPPSIFCCWAGSQYLSSTLLYLQIVLSATVCLSVT